MMRNILNKIVEKIKKYFNLKKKIKKIGVYEMISKQYGRESKSLMKV